VGGFNLSPEEISWLASVGVLVAIPGNGRQSAGSSWACKVGFQLSHEEISWLAFANVLVAIPGR
jgi:nitrate/nitrite transporter NarK